MSPDICLNMMLSKSLIFGLLSLCLMIRCIDGNERCVASIRGVCPSAWSQWGDKCYRKLPVNLPWAEAQEECIKMGSVLVMPQSQEEIEFLQRNVYFWFWINCNDIQREGMSKCNLMELQITNIKNWIITSSTIILRLWWL